MSNVENKVEPCNASRQSWVRGMGQASFLVKRFNCLKSRQGLTLPSFLTRTRGATKGEHEGRIVPCSSNLSRAALSSPAKAKGTRFGESFTGFASPVSIACSYKLVGPKSLSCLENTASYSINSRPMTSFSSDVQSCVHESCSSVRWDGMAA